MFYRCISGGWDVLSALCTMSAEFCGEITRGHFVVGLLGSGADDSSRLGVLVLA